MVKTKHKVLSSIGTEKELFTSLHAEGDKAIILFDKQNRHPGIVTIDRSEPQYAVPREKITEVSCYQTATAIKISTSLLSLSK